MSKKSAQVFGWVPLKVPSIRPGNVTEDERLPHVGLHFLRFDEVLPADLRQLRQRFLAVQLGGVAFLHRAVDGVPLDRDFALQHRHRERARVGRDDLHAGAFFERGPEDFFARFLGVAAVVADDHLARGDRFEHLGQFGVLFGFATGRAAATGGGRAAGGGAAATAGGEDRRQGEGAGAHAAELEQLAAVQPVVVEETALLEEFLPIRVGLFAVGGLIHISAVSYEVGVGCPALCRQSSTFCIPKLEILRTTVRTWQTVGGWCSFAIEWSRRIGPCFLGPPDEDWISSLDIWIQSFAMAPVSTPLVVTGDVITMDPARPRVEALGIVDGRVVAAGTREEALAAVPAGTTELRAARDDRPGADRLPRTYVVGRARDRGTRGRRRRQRVGGADAAGEFAAAHPGARVAGRARRDRPRVSRRGPLPDRGRARRGGRRASRLPRPALPRRARVDRGAGRRAGSVPGPRTRPAA